MSAEQPERGALRTSLAARRRPDEPVWWDRGFLPHVESSQLLQHVCYRLADSLPEPVVQQMEDELKSLPPSLRDPEKERRVNAYLDAGHGSCVLRDPEIARLVERTFLHFHGQRYQIHAWCVMPNHVHVLFQPLGTWTMSKIVASWKSFTGRRISAFVQTGLEPGLGGAGLEPGGPGGRSPGLQPGATRIWQREYFDRYIRDEVQYANVVDYIHNNPVKAGLVAEPQQWASSSAARWKDGPASGRTK
ncbi:MAG: transposase [Flavobacteriales bacterium]|nr:transposase [Flavobacteriales bacterium]